MREISTEEFRKLSADKKAQTLSINTLAYKQGHSYTDKVLKSTDSKDINGKYLLAPLESVEITKIINYHLMTLLV